MQDNKVRNYIKEVLNNMPSGWLSTTTHRLDVYNEELAKTEFLDEFESLYKSNNAQLSDLTNLPTAYDYIRLGHPLSCVLEWTIARISGIKSDHVISFSSKTMPILAILRKNLLDQKKTQILYLDALPNCFDAELIKRVYGYDFDLKKITDFETIPEFNGTTILISNESNFEKINLSDEVDFLITIYEDLGSILLINGAKNLSYISDIQHVRRRETIAMTPADSLIALKSIADEKNIVFENTNLATNKAFVLETIKSITNTTINPIVASSGLSIQYAILMGLIDDALEKYPEKAIKIVVPPNCYGGTNDQARRVAAGLENVEIVDLLVDGSNDMVQSIHSVLTKIANEDAIPLIIAEIPTNPRVEVPNLVDLKEALSQDRQTANGTIAQKPVFILDQTFCPNVHFLGDEDILSSVKTISFASGSKFPSAGNCTAGYCVGNKKAVDLMQKISYHLALCDNEATAFQYEILAKYLPSMNQRIADAYGNTLDFVNFIKTTLPEAKINFVSSELAAQGFTPSVFSLDLPTKGSSEQEKELHKRELNLKLINLMITEIPNESKFCVSYGQLKGCYWTIPATSTQGTTKEGDKDYIVRASLSPSIDLDLHKKVFLDFVKLL